MHKPTIALTIMSLGLAACAGYLAVELKAAHEALARAAPALPLTSSKTRFEQPANALKADTAPAALPGAIPTQSPEAMARGRAILVAQIPEMRDQLENSEKRALLLRSWRHGFRQSFPHLDERLGLNDDEYSRLENLQAEQLMRNMELQYQCALKPACDPMTANSGQKEINDRELADLLGPEKLLQFNLYQDNIQERRAVEALRGALPDAHSLSEGQSEKLIDVLGDTRRQYTRELEQRGASAMPTWNIFGSFVISTTTVGADQKYAEAAEFMQRQRERAAQVLTAEQLKAFTQRQQDMLDGIRTNWEYEEQSNRP